MPRVLFFADKWCEGKIQNGVSEWETNLWKSLECTHLASVDVFHGDDYFLKTESSSDHAFLAKCVLDRPDLIVLVIYRLPGTATNVPSFETLNKISNELHIPILAIWGDLQSNSQFEIAAAVSPYANLNIYTASSQAAKGVMQSDRFLYSWVPKDERLFKNYEVKRDIPIAYLGSPKPDRMTAVHFLEHNGVAVKYTGGERECHITIAHYVELLNRSQISLSFSRSVGTHVVNARVFETMHAGAMLLEQEGDETSKLFEPMVDYVTFKSHEDLLEKARYYLAHPDEAQKIARNGREKTLEKYSAASFWRIAFSKIFEAEVARISTILNVINYPELK